MTKLSSDLHFKMDKHAILTTLTTYKNLSKNRSNHRYLLEDKTAILFSSTLLEENDPEISSECLDVLENFVSNKESRIALVGTFGSLEALESFSIKSRNNCNKHLTERASKLLNELEGIKDVRCADIEKSKTLLPKTNVYLLYVRELAPDTGNKLDASLVKIKGILSFAINIKQKSCKLRTYSDIPLKKIIIDIKKMCKMMPYLLYSNSENEKLLIDVLEKNVIKCIEDNPRGIKSRENNNCSSSWMKNISQFLNESFYW